MTTREEIVAMREAAEDEAEHVLQCCGEYHPDYHEVVDAIFFREAQRQAYERAAKCCDARYMGDNNREDMEAKRCAEAIRSMKV